MKEKYEKPIIVIEDFQIDQHIAGSCRDGLSPGDNPNKYLTHTYYKSSCYVDAGGGLGRVFSNSSCNIGPDNYADLDKECYHIPLNVDKFFAS